jgi:hypothetical protein
MGDVKWRTSRAAPLAVRTEDSSALDRLMTRRGPCVAVLFACLALFRPMPALAADGLAAFVETHCMKCHGPNKQSGDFRVDTLLSGAAPAERWRDVRTELVNGSMPPAKEKQPEARHMQQAVAWIEDRLEKEGKLIARPLPQYGNEVPHEALFDPKNAARRAATPARYWRLSPYIYKKYMARQHQAGGNLVSPFNLLPGNTFKDYALPLQIDEPTAALLWINAESLVNVRLKLDPQTGKLFKPQYKELGEVFDAGATVPSEAKLTKVVTEEFRRIVGRPATPTELQRWIGLLGRNIATGGGDTGLRMTLTVLYLHPEVLYRKEVGEGPADTFGRRMLSPAELAPAIAYALGDAGPDKALITAAETGKLQTAADVAREINRLWDDPKTEKSRIPRFFQEYFGFQNAISVFKTGYVHGLHLPADNIADTEMLIALILQKDRNVLRELLTTSEVVLITDPGGDKRHKPWYVYNFTGPQEHKGPKRRLVPAPQGQRAGILTQPAWLVAQSTNFDNHPIARGHWIREKLLGGVIPEIPLNVDAKLPDDKDKTLRQRMHVTQAEYCWRCHQHMDPLGTPFEMYSHFGRYRDTESVMDLNAPPPAANKPPATLEVPVDATGYLTGTGDPTLDGPVKDAVDLMNRLARSERVEQVFVRHAFRYWMGRNESLDDAATLQAAHRAYRESGGSFRAMVVSLLTSDSFLYRTGSPPTPPGIGASGK